MKHSAFKHSYGWDIWQAEDTDAEPCNHIIPCADEYQHDVSENCACRPQMNADGLWVHRAWDHRDDYEEGKRRPH